MRPGFGDDGVCAWQCRCLVAAVALAAVTFLARTLLHVVRPRMGGVAPTPVWAKPPCHRAGVEGQRRRPHWRSEVWGNPGRAGLATFGDHDKGSMLPLLRQRRPRYDKERLVPPAPE